jgi:uncharacterized protein (DUF3084 family)
MFQDDIFEEWLDKEAKQALDKFKNNETITIEDKMILTLKAQTNHFYHLDKEIREDIQGLRSDTNKRFEQVDKRLEQIDKRFEQVDKRFEVMQIELQKVYQAINSQTWKMIGSVGLIVILGKLIDDFGK